MHLPQYTYKHWKSLSPTSTSKISLLQTFDILSHVFYKSVIEPTGDSFDGYEESRAAPPYPDLGPAPALTQDSGNNLTVNTILKISKVHCMPSNMNNMSIGIVVK